jgi:hypothetical protein
MNCRKCVIAVLACLALGSSLLYGQSYQAKIPFQFTAGNMVHPAGAYTVFYDKSKPKVLSLHPQSGPVIGVPVLTRLSPREQLKQEAQLVFDEVDGKYTLAELYLPGTDGFYLGSVLVEHKHVIIDAPR